MKATVAPDAAFRKKHGIPPKGDGPHPASSYGLPVPPKGHPLAVPYAKAVLSRANQATNFDPALVQKQIAKANVVLYGKPHPTQAEKVAARSRRRERETAFYLGEANVGDTEASPFRKAAVAAGRMMDDAASTEAKPHLADAKRHATQAHISFGQGDMTMVKAANDRAHVALARAATAARSQKDEQTVSKARAVASSMPEPSKTAQDAAKWPDALDTPARESIQPGPKTLEAIRQLRESGKPTAAAFAVHETFWIREADIADDGSVRALAIRVGNGNPTDGNYYDEGFIDSIIPLLEGAHCFRDHPTVTEEKDLPERSIDRLAGWFSDPEKAPFTDPTIADATPVPGAFATFHPRVGDPHVLSLLRTCREKAAKYPTKDPFVGLSVLAYGVGDSGKTPAGESKNILSRCTELKSVDMVTAAGAGGRPIYSTESSRESLDVKTKPKPNAARESFGSAGFQVDLRTPAEILADAEKGVREGKGLAVKDLLKGALGASIVESLKKAGMKFSAAAANASGATPTVIAEAMTPDELSEAADKLGLVKGGAMHGFMADKLGTPAASTDEDPDNPAAEGDPENPEDPEVEEALTAEQIAALTPEQAKAALLKRIKPATEANRPAAKSKREIELERQLAEANRDKTARDRANAFTAVCDTLKVPAEHRVILEQMAGVREASDVKTLQRIIGAYATINLGSVEAGAGGAHLRESGGGKTRSLSFLKS